MFKGGVKQKSFGSSIKKISMSSEKTHNTKVNEVQETIYKMLENENEIEQIKTMIKNQITNSNWRETVKQICSKRIDEENIEELTPELITAMIQEQAYQALPPSLQEQIEHHIITILTKKQVPEKATQ